MCPNKLMNWLHMHWRLVSTITQVNHASMQNERQGCVCVFVFVCVFVCLLQVKYKAVALTISLSERFYNRQWCAYCMTIMSRAI